MTLPRHGLARPFTLLGSLAFVAVSGGPMVRADELPPSRRSQVSQERAVHMEALVSMMFPGGTLDWDREQIVLPDGRRLRHSLAFFYESARGPDGEVFVAAASDTEEATRKAISDLQRFESVTRFGEGCRLSFLRLERTGKVVGFRQATPDLAAEYVACTRADLESAHASAGILPPHAVGAPEPPWPFVFVQLTSVHRLPGVWALITWAAVLDTESGRWISRLPVWIEGAHEEGRPFAFAIRNDRGAKHDGHWLFNGVGTRGELPPWTLRTPCPPSRCVVPPETVLDLLRR